MNSDPLEAENPVVERQGLFSTCRACPNRKLEYLLIFMIIWLLLLIELSLSVLEDVRDLVLLRVVD